MLPSGTITNQVLDTCRKNLSKNDIVIDAGNSHYKNSVEQGEKFSKKGISFFDVGTSGGVEGAKNGACMMIGG